jgi:Bifunctional DNA primase/polymerase, N-terminal
MIRQALSYAEAGWPVFPCQPGQKLPATKHGFKDATTDPDRISHWWKKAPDCNVAIATGTPGPDVLDVDVHPTGHGYAAFNRLKREGLLDGARAYVRTPSGGLHAYFGGSEQGNGRLPEQHLDFRARGGYVVAPPSQVGERPYELVKTADGQGGLDWSAATRLLEPERERRSERPVEQPTEMRHLASWVERLKEGNRNDGLFWAACRVLEAGQTLDPLTEAALKTGLSEREIRRTLDSAVRAARPFEREAEQ